MWWVARVMPLLGNADPGETSDTSILLILVALAVLGGNGRYWQGCRLLRARKWGVRLACRGWHFGRGGVGVCDGGAWDGVVVWICQVVAREQRAGCCRGTTMRRLKCRCLVWHWGWWGVLAAV